MGSPVQINGSGGDLGRYLASHAVRFHALDFLPVANYDSFPAGKTSTLVAPNWIWESKGTAVESGHSMLYSVERMSATYPSPTSASGNNIFSEFPVTVTGRMQAWTSNTANLSGDDAFGAVTLFDPGVTVPNYSTGALVIQLRKSFKNPTNWTLYACDGAGTEYNSTVATVPETGSTGHHFQIYHNAGGVVSAVVDGISISLDFSASWDSGAIANTNLVGFTVYAGGLQTAATQSHLIVSDLAVINHTGGL